LVLSAAIAMVLALSAVPAMGAISMTNGASATGAGSAGGCPKLSAATKTAEQQVYNSAQQTFQQLVPQPANLQSSTCFSNILNMGSNIGLSFFNPAQLLQQMESMACSAAQNAVQWPVQQVQNYVGQNGQLPYGLGGANINTNNSGSVGVTNAGSSSGPYIGLPNTGNSTLNNILG
jgi:hypothetical protein